MAKGKSANPADAFRKAQRAKELKKNKADRQKSRETATLKKDTGGLEAEIRRLSSAEKLDRNQQARLDDLRAEVERIKKTKEEYVKEHPEHRKLVYAGEERRKEEAEERKKADQKNGGGKPLYDDQGRLRDPTRSIYYDPVLNPWGAPPPGMPYRERPGLEPTKDDQANSEDEEDDSDDDIVMPDSPPPGGDAAADAESSDDDDESIDLPDGTPPPEAIIRPPPVAPTAMLQPPPPPPPMMPPPPFGHAPYPGMPPPTMYGPPGFMPGPPPPMPFHNNGYPGQPMLPPQQQPFYPAPPPGFFPNAQAGPGPNSSMHGRPAPSSFHHQGRPPRGPVQALHDPLSDVPHQTFQAARQARQAGPAASSPSSLPAKPTGAAGDSNATKPAAPAVISAEPQLRDLRKEAAVFAPRAVKKKKAGGAQEATIDAAPADQEEKQPARPVDSEGDRPVQPAAPTYNPNAMGGGLLSKLGSVLGTQVSPKPEASPKVADDYQAFLAGLEKLK